MSADPVEISRTEIKPESRRFINLGNDVTFVEGCASSRGFDLRRGDNRIMVYFPVQIKDTNLAIRMYSLEQSVPEVAGHLMNVTLRDGTADLEAFGCVLSETGVFWTCIFNKNKVIGVNLNTRTVQYEVDVSAPNDISFSSANQNILYVVGGSKRGVMNFPTMGKIYRIDCTELAVTCEVVVDKLDTLAGIFCKGSYLYYSNLLEINRISLEQLEGKRGKRIGKGEVEGENCWSAEKRPGGALSEKIYLSGNVDDFDEENIISPCYREIEVSMIPLIKNPVVATTGWTVAKLFTCCLGLCTSCNCHSWRAVETQLATPEVEKRLSELDSFPNSRFFIYNVVTNTSHGFIVPMETNPEEYRFDGHVTDIRLHDKYLIFTNFKSSYFLILEASEIRSYLSIKARVI